MTERKWSSSLSYSPFPLRGWSNAPPLNPVFAEIGGKFPLSLNMKKKTSVNILFKKQLGEIRQENERHSENGKKYAFY